MSITESLNLYRTSVKLANYKTCIKCKTNCNEFGACEVFPEAVGLHLNAEMLKLRRQGRFWLCNKCSKEDVVENSVVLSSVTLNCCTFSDRQMFTTIRKKNTKRGIYYQPPKLFFSQLLVRV